MRPPPRTEQPRRSGSLYLIGGAESRGADKRVLSRLVEIAGGEAARIVLLTAASRHQAEVRQAYEQAFSSLGAARCQAISIEGRDEADDPRHAQALLQAGMVFMSGGDQRRLIALVGGTRTERALHLALHERGACIAGTSAGAAAMSQQMLSDGLHEEGHLQPGEAAQGGARLSPGLGLLQGLVIDQHFTQRQRLGRLVAIVEQHPGLLGVGIDEDTALHIRPGRGIEVVGSGAVTLVDADAAGAPRLHRLPAGLRCDAHGSGVNGRPMHDGAPQPRLQRARKPPESGALRALLAQIVRASGDPAPGPAPESNGYKYDGGRE